MKHKAMTVSLIVKVNVVPLLVDLLLTRRQVNSDNKETNINFREKRARVNFDEGILSIFLYNVSLNVL